MWNCRLLGLTILLILTGCAHSTAQSHDARIDTNRLNPDGIWQSDGYGWLVYNSQDGFRFFHITEKRCSETDVSDISLSDVFDKVRVSNRGLDTLYFSTSTEPQEFRFDRLNSIPTRCFGESSPSQAEAINAMVELFKTHYGFFNDRSVNSTEFFDRLRSLAEKELGDDELFEAVKNVLQPLNDAHVEMSAVINGQTRSFDADPGLLRAAAEKIAKQKGVTPNEATQGLIGQLWDEGVSNSLYQDYLGQAGNGRIRYGLISDKIGYFGVRSMGGFLSSERSGNADLSEADVLDEALDRAMTLFSDHDTRAVIIDLSINSGGYAYLGMRLAERFTDKRRLAYRSRAVDAAKVEWFDHTIEPNNKPSFDGPTYVLTSRISVSAAESTTLLFRALPNSKHVGERTRGALSGKLAKPLPNGWEISLANELYLDHRGKQWEGRGIAPDVPFPVFANNDLVTGHKRTITRLVALIEEDLRD